MKKLAISFALALSCAGIQAATVYTGDRIQNVPVISELDVADLTAGQTHRFFFAGTTDGIGQTLYVPVIVTKGAEAGPKLVLNSGNHGDEVTGIRTVQRIMAEIDANKLKGVIVATTGTNPTAITHITREWTSYTGTAASTNFNRVFPGKEKGTQQEQHAWLLWNKLWHGNVDYAIDYHTNSTGANYPFFIYVDYRNEQAKTLAELFPADQIKKDPGEPGSFETTFIEANIPSMTLELGNARSFDEDKISRAIQGTRNVLIYLKMMEGEISQTAKTQNTYIGNKFEMVRAVNGGYAETYVKVGDMVKKDQPVAAQFNVFGDIVQEFVAPADGKVLSVATDAVREPRASLVRLLVQSQEESCKDGC